MNSYIHIINFKKSLTTKLKNIQTMNNPILTDVVKYFTRKQIEINVGYVLYSLYIVNTYSI